MSSGRTGRGRGWGRGSHLSHNPWMSLINLLGLCQYHKDWISFFSICTYLFNYCCLFQFLCVSTSLDSPVIHQRASWAIPKTYSGGIHTFFAVISKSQMFRLGVSGIWLLQVLHRVFSGCSRPRPLCAFSHCFFLTYETYSFVIVWYTVCYCL